MSPRHASIVAALVVSPLMLACENPPAAPGTEMGGGPSSIEPSAAVNGGAEEGPFYYFGEEKIPLRARPGEVVVESRQGPGVQLEELLASAGVSGRVERNVAQGPAHFLLQTPGRSEEQVAQIARKLRGHSGFSFASPVYEVVDTESTFLPLNRLVVKFRGNVSRADIREFNEDFGTRIVREPEPEHGFDYHWLAYPDNTQNPLEVAAKVHEHEFVEWADPDRVMDARPAAAPNDPYYPDQYYLDGNPSSLNGVPVDIATEPAWNITSGYWAVDVYVLDTGVQEHPDTGMRSGYDAFTNSCCGHVSSDPATPEFHGTAVAGIVAADQDNFTGVSGVAPGATIVPGRVFRWNPSIGALEFASCAQVTDAINYGYASLGVEVINASFSVGSPCFAMAEAFASAAEFGRDGLGTAVVAAAGNTSDRQAGQVGSPTWPATMVDAVGVGAINQSGGVTNYSPEGSAVELVAPSGHVTGGCTSGDVVTLDLVGAPGCSNGPGGDDDYTSFFSGTSAAAPQVAGAFALIFSQNPDITYADARARLQETADPWGDGDRFGAGKLNVGQALNSGGDDPPEPEPCIPTPPQLKCTN